MCTKRFRLKCHARQRVVSNCCSIELDFGFVFVHCHIGWTSINMTLKQVWGARKRTNAKDTQIETKLVCCQFSIVLRVIFAERGCSKNNEQKNYMNSVSNFVISETQSNHLRSQYYAWIIKMTWCMVAPVPWQLGTNTSTCIVLSHAFDFIDKFYFSIVQSKRSRQPAPLEPRQLLSFSFQFLLCGCVYVYCNYY